MRSLFRQILSKPKPMPVLYPPAPSGWTLFAVGDIHGRLDCLLHVQALIDAAMLQCEDKQRCAEIYLGDFIDRGPNSAQVLENLHQRQTRRHVGLIQGNHETMMLGYLAGGMSFEAWKAFGGAETLLSYGISEKLLRTENDTLRHTALEAIPAAHVALIKGAKKHIKFGSYCFVHAGIRPGFELENQPPNDLSWVRSEFLESSEDFGFIVVHGHTAVQEIDFRRNRINVDTGAYITNVLSAIRIDAQGVSALSAATDAQERRE